MSFKSLVTALISLGSFAASYSNLVAVQQDAAGKGTIETILPSTGEITSKSDISFTFSWPHVQMTAKSDTRDVYIVTFPTDVTGPVLYLLDQKLSLIHSWTATPFSFFDLQYSAIQKTLYGIYVSSTYGRVLTNYTANTNSNEVVGQQLFVLPYMWYVNASSFHTSTCTYFALINNFPGQSNSTSEQQLIVADFSKDISVSEPHVNVFKIQNSSALLQFIAYSAVASKLFYAGIKVYGSVIEVGTMDIKTGQVSAVGVIFLLTIVHVIP